MNTTVAHSTSCQREYEQVCLSPSASNKQKRGFLGTELSQRAVVVCFQNVNWAYLHTAEFVRNEDFFSALPTPQARNNTRTTHLRPTAPASGPAARLCPGFRAAPHQCCCHSLALLGFNHVALQAAVHRKEGFLKFGDDLEIWRQGEENCGLKGI